MQTPAQAPAPVAAPPTLPPGQPVIEGVPGLTQFPAKPLTARDVAALRAQRSQLSDQLESAVGRRNRIAEQLRSASPSEQPGLKARLDLLDRRILQLEGDLAESGRALSSALASGTATTAPPPNFGGLSTKQVTAISILSVIFVLGPMAMGVAYSLIRRANRPPPSPPSQDNVRLERIEQAVDAIAIEVERISEGQRFVTRILTEQQELPALGAGQRAAEPIPIRQGEGVRRG
jgi:hypothetical protein